MRNALTGRAQGQGPQVRFRHHHAATGRLPGEDPPRAARGESLSLRRRRQIGDCFPLQPLGI